MLAWWWQYAETCSLQNKLVQTIPSVVHKIAVLDGHFISFNGVLYLKQKLETIFVTQAIRFSHCGCKKLLFFLGYIAYANNSIV
jgi:hypothetical protein